MKITFEALAEDEPGSTWQALFDRHWDAYRQWFQGAGDEARPSFLAARRMLREYLPELLPTWERLVDLAGGGDLVARFLSGYRPPPYITGCSQAVRGSHRDAILVRNYDYAPALCEGTLLLTRWNGRRVIAMSDCLWGALDGINDAGLCVSLAFGGRREVGDGFGMPLIQRYILEFCDSCQAAVEVLLRVPSHMSYNVTLLDRHGDYRTVFVAPDREPRVSGQPLATNHQRDNSWKRYTAATASLEREQYLATLLEDRRLAQSAMVDAFLQPPLYSFEFGRGFGTLYTALYRPAAGKMELRWPTTTWTQSFDRFVERRQTIVYRVRAQRHDPR